MYFYRINFYIKYDLDDCHEDNIFILTHKKNLSENKFSKYIEDAFRNVFRKFAKNVKEKRIILKKKNDLEIGNHINEIIQCLEQDGFKKIEFDDDKYFFFNQSDPLHRQFQIYDEYDADTFPLLDDEMRDYYLKREYHKNKNNFKNIR